MAIIDFILLYEAGSHPFRVVVVRASDHLPCPDTHVHTRHNMKTEKKPAWTHQDLAAVAEPAAAVLSGQDEGEGLAVNSNYKQVIISKN